MLEHRSPGGRLAPLHRAGTGRACDGSPARGGRLSDDGGPRGAGAWLRCRIRTLRRLLGGRLRVEGRGRHLRLVVDPAWPSIDAAAQVLASREIGSPSLPAIHAADLANARIDLTAILDRHPAARALWPSLAVMERGLNKHGGSSFARMSAAVLRDAAKVLGRLVDDWCEPGIVALYEHVLLVLRTVHGEVPAYVAVRAERPFEAQVQDGSMTDFMTIDRLWDQRLAGEG